MTTLELIEAIKALTQIVQVDKEINQVSYATQNKAQRLLKLAVDELGLSL